MKRSTTGGKLPLGRPLLLLLVVVLCVSCSSVGRPPVTEKLAAMAPAKAGALADVSRDVGRRFGADQSGFVLLKTNRDALDWRLALIDHAQQSIDLQYYIWKADDSGGLLFGRLLDAAERGVKVRLLVDDFPFAGDGKTIQPAPGPWARFLDAVYGFLPVKSQL